MYDQLPKNLEITRQFADAMQLSWMGFAQELMEAGSGAAENLLTRVLKLQEQQMDYLVRAVGNLESLTTALQKTSGFETIHYPQINISREDKSDPEN